MGKTARGVFKRGLDYVAVRHIRLTSKVVIEPGQPVKLRQHQMRNLFLRRKIGVKGHPWTEQALANPEGAPLEHVSTKKAEAAAAAASETGKPEVEKDQRPWVGEGGARFKTKAEAIDAGHAEPVNDKLVWVAGAERFKTKKAAEAYIAENWPVDE